MAKRIKRCLTFMLALLLLTTAIPLSNVQAYSLIGGGGGASVTRPGQGNVTYFSGSGWRISLFERSEIEAFTKGGWNCQNELRRELEASIILTTKSYSISSLFSYGTNVATHQETKYSSISSVFPGLSSSGLQVDPITSPSGTTKATANFSMNYWQGTFKEYVEKDADQAVEYLLQAAGKSFGGSQSAEYYAISVEPVCIVWDQTHSGAHYAISYQELMNGEGKDSHVVEYLYPSISGALPSQWENWSSFPRQGWFTSETLRLMGNYFVEGEYGGYKLQVAPYSKDAGFALFGGDYLKSADSRISTNLAIMYDGATMSTNAPLDIKGSTTIVADGNKIIYNYFIKQRVYVFT